ncbi:hypothetical protein J1N35_041803 [Gossypium stocksii]|uniref:Reverse transcriptase domain-containing protein n=1 Tax=Gossypium stocksii TaxID=47602 RepID=A0A9D3ZIZ7_9ROSI|nr:hypothetical protein J1N35_041803 [Gossypium stocksii]
MEGIAISYFQNLFLLEARGNYDHLLSGIGKCIFEEDNQRLIAPYTMKEIIEAMFEMGPTKALREDGLPAVFYQKCWHIIGDDMIKFHLQILNEGMEIKHINSTHIALIPKIVNPFTMKQFRPISLCNVIYKILAKTIANWFRGVIDKCIDVA